MKKLEQQLNSFDEMQRKDALKKLSAGVDAGEIKLPAFGRDTNIHYHTFYSYNACGWSPCRIAWESRKLGVAVAGIVDFDVLDGLEEFLWAAELLGMKGFAGIETRVFIPQFASREINSPGEPGISYHMGVGIPFAEVDAKLESFKSNLLMTAQQRNRELLKRVNSFLSPAALDFERDVRPLTPEGNATERHICLAYARKARGVFADDAELAKFWCEKLGEDADGVELPESLELQNLIRAKTMKQGSCGYVKADAGSFPDMAEMNEFVIAVGGIPTLAWLNGMTEGEAAIEELLEVSMSTGMAAVNIIPDRNFTPGLGDDDVKCRTLYRIVELCKDMYLPLIAGTEMNSPGQKIVDDFESAELSPLRDIFLAGANIVYAHSCLQRFAEIGYLGGWAEKNFTDVKEKNKFFEQLGSLLRPGNTKVLRGLDETFGPELIIEIVKNQ